MAGFKTTRRGFVLLTGGLAASVPFLNTADVVAATQKIDEAARGPKPVIDKLTKQEFVDKAAKEAAKAFDLDRDRLPTTPGPGQLLVDPIREGTFFVKSVDINNDLDSIYGLGDQHASYIPRGMSVEVRLVSSGPISSRVMKMLMDCPEVEFYGPGEELDIPSLRPTGRSRSHRASGISYFYSSPSMYRQGDLAGVYPNQTLSSGGNWMFPRVNLDDLGR